MLEIKFRGKRLYDQAETTKHYAAEKGTWLFGTYTYAHKYRGGEHGHLICDIYGRPIMCDEKTIGQYIGLKDKNGVEVYADDEINLDLPSGIVKCIVKWEKHFLSWVFYNPKTTRFTTYKSLHSGLIEVVGNIHDEVKK